MAASLAVKVHFPTNIEGSNECDLGCKTCSADSPQICSACIDEQNASVQTNICVCSGYHDKFNIQGYCVKCPVDGCKACTGGHTEDERASLTCAICLDPEAIIVDGQCVCPDGEYMVEGLCQPQCPYSIINGICKACQIQGCRFCPSSPRCSECMDKSRYDPMYSICYCPTGTQLNQNEMCTACNVPGCKYCRPDQIISSTCIECFDPNAAIVEGACTCPTDQYLNVEGICEEGCLSPNIVVDGSCVTNCSNTYGCSGCSNGICSSCLQYSSYIENNECKCSYEGQSMNTEGRCRYCLVAGCKTCEAPEGYSSESYSCHECLDSTATKKNGQCVCPDGKVMLDGMCEDSCPYFLSNGHCHQCNIPGCKICPNPDRCDECIDPYNTKSTLATNGLCECKEALAFNAAGYCTSCNFLGCKTCQADGFESSKCAECSDPLASVSNGECSCPNYMNDQGMCVDDCSNGVLTSKVCMESCDDTFGCSNCQGGICSQCFEGSTQVFNKCVCDDNSLSMLATDTCGLCWVPGCKACTAELRVTAQMEMFLRNPCSQCLDPSASLEDGRCVCPGGKILLDGYCQEECPTSVVRYGQCQKCQVEGCKLCLNSSPTICLECFDSSARNRQTYCDCLSKQLNEAGYCAQCKAAYCKTCEADGQVSYRCVDCIDPNALLSAGSCTCAEGQGFDRNGFCRQCLSNEILRDGQCVFSCEDTYGCTNCLNGECSSCGSQISVKHNECVCENKGQSMRTDGICGDCWIPGCHTCQAGETSPCVKCLDPSATLQHGRCVCPNNQFLVDGYCKDTCPYIEENGLCKKCLVEGCKRCDDDPNYCQECTQQGTYPFEGKCLTIACDDGKKFNEAGYCATCAAYGCRTCEADGPTSSRCIECSDPDAVLQNGVCNCPTGLIFHARKEGFCLSCSQGNQIVSGNLCVRHCDHSYGCADCQGGVCNSCSQTQDIVELKNNQCVCISQKQAMTKSGVCSENRVPGCAVISEDNYYQCLECKDPEAKLENGKCVCLEGQYLADGICMDYCPFNFFDGQCRKCSMEFCSDCSSYYCNSCNDVENTYGGTRTCSCKGSTLQMNAAGFCVICAATACKTCEADQSQVSYRCAECLDPEAIPVDGVCTCLGKQTFEGICYSCLVPGCSECEDGLARTCKICTDPEATLNQDGQCECPEGRQMNSEGTCQSKCKDAQFEFYEHCVACLPGCAECSQQDPTICTSCDDEFYLEGQFCYQCPEGCLGCSSPTICGSCANTHEPAGQECVPKCNFPCQTCPADNPDFCESCVDGYDPVDATCAQAESCSDSNCVFCPVSADVCERCAAGFQEFRGTCSEEGKFLFGGSKELSAMLEKHPEFKRRLSQTLIQRF